MCAAAALWALVLIGAPAARAVTIDEFPLGATPTGITAGLDGNLYVTTTAPSILRVSPAGEVTARFPLTFSGAPVPSSPVFSAGALWFSLARTDGSSGAVTYTLGRRAPDGTITELPRAVSAATPAPDGGLWTNLGRLGANGQVQVAASIPGTVTSMATDPAGQVWATTSDRHAYTVSPTGAVSPSQAPGGALGVAAGPGSDALWILGRDEIGCCYGVTWADWVYVMPTGASGTRVGTGFLGTSNVQAITVGPDGGAWVTDTRDSHFTMGTARIGRVTSAGRTSEYSAGLAADAQPGKITRGPGDTVWFTDASNRVGRVSIERPTAVADPAANVSQTGAGMAATVVPAGTPTRVRFAFGPAGGALETTRWQEAGDGESAVRRAFRLDGLAAGTKYLYRVEISSGFGLITGPDMTFTTDPVPPPPPVPPADVDRDGYAIGVDCNDSDPRTYPGATDVPGDGRDQDCSGADEPWPRFFPHVTAFFKNKARRWSRGTELVVDDVPVGAAVELRCSGRGCRFTRWRDTVRRETEELNLLPHLKRSSLAPGAVLELRLALGGHVGTIVRWKVGPPPKPTVTCLAPNSTKDHKC